MNPNRYTNGPVSRIEFLGVKGCALGTEVGLEAHNKEVATVFHFEALARHLHAILGAQTLNPKPLNPKP